MRDKDNQKNINWRHLCGGDEGRGARSGALTVDQHACGQHQQEQQPLVPDTPINSAGSRLETAARVLLRARSRQSRASPALIGVSATSCPSR